MAYPLPRPSRAFSMSCISVTFLPRFSACPAAFPSNIPFPARGDDPPPSIRRSCLYILVERRWYTFFRGDMDIKPADASARNLLLAGIRLQYDAPVSFCFHVSGSLAFPTFLLRVGVAPPRPSF